MVDHGTHRVSHIQGLHVHPRVCMVMRGFLTPQLRLTGHNRLDARRAAPWQVRGVVPVFGYGGDMLERTPEAQRGFDLVLSQVRDGLDFSEDPNPTRVDTPVVVVDSEYDMFREGLWSPRGGSHAPS